MAIKVHENSAYLTTKRYAGGLPMVVSYGSWFVDGQDNERDVLKKSKQQLGGLYVPVWLRVSGLGDSGSDVAQRVACNRWNYQDGAKLGSRLFGKGETSVPLIYTCRRVGPR